MSHFAVTVRGTQEEIPKDILEVIARKIIGQMVSEIDAPRSIDATSTGVVNELMGPEVTDMKQALKTNWE